jgi:serine/threonine protein kinase
MFQPSTYCVAEARISTFFDSPQPRSSFSDAEIEEIKQLLLRCDHYNKASNTPRTFIVLRYIDQLGVLFQLLADGFEDSWFPIGKRSLPSFLDPRIKAAIVESQHIIFTKSIDLEKGIHCYLDSTEELPFNRINYIGSGAYGQVSRIESKVTCKPYALKTIRRRAAYGLKSRQVMRQFISEMKIMKSLRHHHIVRYIGSYTDKKDLGLVISPVADCDLAVYLHTYCTQPVLYPTIRTFYGCLASALAYLHDRRIKHRDIKPSNILVYRASILITDFGLSRESLDTTSGTDSGTSRYQSPEMAAAEPRNASTDVWSLGCVFLEMLAALNGTNVDWLKAYYGRVGTRSTHFHANAFATQRVLAQWRPMMLLKYAKPIAWIKAMLIAEHKARPTAAHIAAEITASGDGTRFTYSCNACGDDFSDSDSESLTNETPASPTSPGKSDRIRVRRGPSVSRHDPASNVFVSAIAQHGEYNMEHVGFLCDGVVYTYRSTVPVVFGKCIEHILAIEGNFPMATPMSFRPPC